MNRIDALTREQSAMLEPFQRRWAAAKVSTAPSDRPAAEEGVKLAYRAAGLAPPRRIVWCGGPVELSGDWARAGTRRQRLSDGPIGANTRAALVDRVRQDVDTVLRPRLGIGVLNTVQAGVRSSTGETVSTEVVGAVTRGTQRARPPAWTVLGWALRQLVSLDSPTRTWPSFVRSSFGPHDLGWLATYDYLREACGLRRETDALRGLWLLGLNVGWVLPHRHVCWLADRACVVAFDNNGRLHHGSGPALAYRDGWSAYFWKGVEVPAEVIERRDHITLEQIDRQSDVFVRRCMIEAMTPQRFLAMGGADRVGQDDCGILWRKAWWTGDAWAAVEVVNGTAEPDGTHRHYVLQVPPDIRTPRAAVAWTYGMTDLQYARLMVRT